MVFVLPNTKSTFRGSNTVAKSIGCVEITDEQFKALVSDKLIWEEGKLVPNPAPSVVPEIVKAM